MVRSDREQALSWWFNLDARTQITLAAKHFKSEPFVLVSTSSQRVESIWRWELEETKYE